MQAAALVPSAFSIPKEVSSAFFSHLEFLSFFFLLFLVFLIKCARRVDSLLGIACGFLQGKGSASFKESGLFGVSLSDHVKADFSSSALRNKVMA